MRRRVFAAGVVALVCGVVLVGGLSAARAVGRVAAAGPYYVFILTNVGDPGNIWVGTEADLKGKRTCDFIDGGLCKSAGGSDVPVTYVAKSKPRVDCDLALYDYEDAATNPHPAFGGTKVYIYGGSYFIDNKARWCQGGKHSPPQQGPLPPPKTTTAPKPPTVPTQGKDLKYGVITKIVGDVGVLRPGDKDWVDAKAGEKLLAADDVHTGPDSEVDISFPDGSTVRIHEDSHIQIRSFLNTENRSKIELILKFGELNAKVVTQEGIRSDFSVNPPIATDSVRGSAMIVSYDPKTRVATVTVTQDKAYVVPRVFHAMSPGDQRIGSWTPGRAKSAEITVLQGHTLRVGPQGVIGATAPPPATAPASGQGASVTFTSRGGKLPGAASAVAANGFEANMDPHTGQIVNAYWTKDGKSLAPVTVPSGADGAVLATAPGAAAGAPLPRPAAATGIHVFWNSAGVITSAGWYSVGKLLATIPVASGQNAIAFTNGTG